MGFARLFTMVWLESPVSVPVSLSHVVPCYYSTVVSCWWQERQCLGQAKNVCQFHMRQDAICLITRQWFWGFCFNLKNISCLMCLFIYQPANHCVRWCFRGGMIQTHEQYDFVHQALVEYERCLGEPSIQSVTALTSDGHWAEYTDSSAPLTNDSNSSYNAPMSDDIEQSTQIATPLLLMTVTVIIMHWYWAEYTDSNGPLTNDSNSNNNALILSSVQR
jgi:hypothetical protein